MSLLGCIRWTVWINRPEAEQPTVRHHARDTAWGSQDGQAPGAIDAIAEKTAYLVNAPVGLDIVDSHELQPG